MTDPTAFDDVDWCPIHGDDLVGGRCPRCQPTRGRPESPYTYSMSPEVVTIDPPGALTTPIYTRRVMKMALLAALAPVLMIFAPSLAAAIVVGLVGVLTYVALAVMATVRRHTRSK
jgi:hypothetical protein